MSNDNDEPRQRTRKLNPFFIFLREFRRNIQSKSKQLGVTEICALAGRKWRRMTSKQKEKYVRLSKKEARETYLPNVRQHKNAGRPQNDCRCGHAHMYDAPEQASSPFVAAPAKLTGTRFEQEQIENDEDKPCNNGRFGITRRNKMYSALQQQKLENENNKPSTSADINRSRPLKRTPNIFNRNRRYDRSRSMRPIRTLDNIGLPHQCKMNNDDLINDAFENDRTNNHNSPNTKLFHKQVSSVKTEVNEEQQNDNCELAKTESYSQQCQNEASDTSDTSNNKVKIEIAQIAPQNPNNDNPPSEESAAPASSEIEIGGNESFFLSNDQLNPDILLGPGIKPLRLQPFGSNSTVEENSDISVFHHWEE